MLHLARLRLDQTVILYTIWLTDRTRSLPPRYAGTPPRQSLLDPRRQL